MENLCKQKGICLTHVCNPRTVFTSPQNQGPVILITSLRASEMFLFIYLFIYWLYRVFLVGRRLSLVAASGGYSSLWYVGFSLQWLLLLWSIGSRHMGFSSCRTQTQQFWPLGFSCFVACGIFLDQGLNSCYLHCQAYSYLLYYRGSLTTEFLRDYQKISKKNNQTNKQKTLLIRWCSGDGSKMWWPLGPICNKLVCMPRTVEFHPPACVWRVALLRQDHQESALFASNKIKLKLRC